MPEDLRRFWVWKDSSGITQVHNHTCPFIGQKGIYLCSCRIGLSSNYVSGLVSQLGNVFECCGSARCWDEVK